MLKVNELLKATGGCLISGRENIVIKGISIDSRTIKRGEAFIAIKGDNFDGHDFIAEAIKRGASCIIHEPRTTSCLPAGRNHEPRKSVFIEVKDTIRALGDIARFQRNKFDIPIIAVTGSNGKTTAKEMISWVLSKKFKVLKNEGTKNNQIGLPLTLLNLNRSYDIVVLEIGTNHFGEVENLAKVCLPNIGIITNIGPAHLEYLCNLKGVLREKYALIRNLKEPHLAILNLDNTLLRRQILKKFKKPIILSFSIKHRADFYVSNIKNFHDKIEFLVNQKYKFTLKTLGRHNIYNALVAIAVARVFGTEYKDIASQLAIFDFPQGRFNFVTLNKIRFIDDTYNSNPFSLKQALDTLANSRVKGRKIFVMGDMLELGSAKELLHYRVGGKVKQACDVFITVGKLSRLAAEAARRSGFDIKNIFTCQSTQEACDILFNKISPRPDDLVLVKGSRAMKMEEIIRV